MWPELVVAALSAGEMVGLVLAAYLVFRSRGATLAEAVAYALFLPLMALSFVFRLTAITGWSLLTFATEAGMILLSGYSIYRFKNQLKPLVREFIQFARTHCLASAVLMGGGLLLVTKIFIAGGTVSGNIDLLSSAGPGNPDLLCYYWSRFGSHHRCGFFGLMAYLTTVFATYALARRYAWPPTAIAVTLIVASMPRLVYLATSCGTEILSAAAAVFSVLAIYRTIEQPNTGDLSLLLWGTVYGISSEAASIIFPIIMLPLSLLLMYRRHGFQTWWALIKRQRKMVALVLFPALIFAQLPWLINRWVDGATDAAPANFKIPPFNPDGIIGTLANTARYLLESIHLTLPIEGAVQWVFSFSPMTALQAVHDNLVTPLWANQGAVEAFNITWPVATELSWFGPFAFFLILPAMLYAAFKAPRRLKAVAVTLLGYFYLIALIFAWSPGNARFFTLFFVTGGYFIAFLLPPWRLSRRQRGVLVLLSSALFFYALGAGPI